MERSCQEKERQEKSSEQKNGMVCRARYFFSRICTEIYAVKYSIADGTNAIVPVLFVESL